MKPKSPKMTLHVARKHQLAFVFDYTLGNGDRDESSRQKAGRVAGASREPEAVDIEEVEGDDDSTRADDEGPRQQ